MLKLKKLSSMIEEDNVLMKLDDWRRPHTGRTDF
jgi:hypothetical protein